MCSTPVVLAACEIWRVGREHLLALWFHGEEAADNGAGATLFWSMRRRGRIVVISPASWGNPAFTTRTASGSGDSTTRTSQRTAP